MIRPQEERQGGKREREKELKGERTGGGGREADKTWKREMGWGARQRSRQRDGAVKKGETVRPRKDRAAAPAYQLFHETSALISINSNDKCGPLWQRLINSRRGETHQSKNSNHSMPQAWTSVKRERVELHCVFGITTVALHVLKRLQLSFRCLSCVCFLQGRYIFSAFRLSAQFLEKFEFVKVQCCFFKIFHIYTVCVGGSD